MWLFATLEKEIHGRSRASGQFRSNESDGRHKGGGHASSPKQQLCDRHINIGTETTVANRKVKSKFGRGGWRDTGHILDLVKAYKVKRIFEWDRDGGQALLNLP